MQWKDIFYVFDTHEKTFHRVTLKEVKVIKQCTSILTGSGIGLVTSHDMLSQKEIGIKYDVQELENNSRKIAQVAIKLKVSNPHGNTCEESSLNR